MNQRSLPYSLMALQLMYRMSIQLYWKLHELDIAEEAQKRMELMYNVDAWSTQLVVRVGSGQVLLTSTVEGTKEITQGITNRWKEEQYGIDSSADAGSSSASARPSSSCTTSGSGV